jgi:hypothetical protein
MELYQIIVPVICLGFIWFSFKNFRSSEITIWTFVFWMIFWVFILLIALFPDQITDFIANVLGFKSNINALIFLALGILFFMNFRLIQIINKLERRITELIRSDALEKASKEKKK